MQDKTIIHESLTNPLKTWKMTRAAEQQ